MKQTLPDDQVTTLIVISNYHERDSGKSCLRVKMLKEMKGVCFLFSETGTEGGWWAMQEDGFVAEDGHWKYEGLQLLKEGDDFTVLW